MIPPKQIGKHSIQLQDVRSVIAIRHWWFWTRYNVMLAGGQIITLTKKEKAELDTAIEHHILTMGIYKNMTESRNTMLTRAQQKRG